MKKRILFVLLLLTSLTWSCTGPKNNLDFLIESDWQFRKAGDKEWLKATVPGCVHTDLLDNSLIPDPFFQKNELAVKWIENADWEYQTTFTVSDEMAAFENADLQFGGLDTYADVYLNDSLVLEADNMFVAWEVPAKRYLKKGENQLRIYFHSAVNTGMKKLKNVPYLIMAANELAPENERTNVFTRKAPFHYGWDWGPRLVTCGVWKPVRIQGWNNARMNNIYIKPVLINKEVANYKAIVDVVTNSIAKISFDVLVENKIVVSKPAEIFQKGNNQIAIDFKIENPEFWWTNGLGEHKLYNVEVRMNEGKNEIQGLSAKIGVRTLELVRTPDSLGNTFHFRLNGVPVFMKGSNYIPSDIFLTRNTIRNYKRVVSDAVNANMNMLRIWGGAVYESDEFYDLLDENGILAWNDFMFSCNMQPDDSLHLENIRKEAIYNVKRLRNHPSIALWCGNNENLRAWNDWGWKQKVTKEQGDVLWAVYEKIFYKILPDAVQMFHPEISYWPSSPQTENNKGSDPSSGDEHDWRIWFGDVPFSTYSKNVCRFVSEYGLQSFPEMKTIKAFAADSDMAYRSPVMEHRQRSLMPWIADGFNGNEMIMTYIKRYYQVPEKFENFVYVSQLMQAEGVKYAIETHRRNMPHCMGSLYWQINDCWPTMSWSSVDYFGRWKALHYAVKKAFAPVCPVIFREKSNIVVSIANDDLKTKNASLEARLYDFNGKVLWEKKLEIQLEANSSQIYLSVPESELSDKSATPNTVFEAVVKSGDQIIGENLFYFKDFKDLHFDNPNIKKIITKLSDQEYEIQLTAEKLAKNIAFFTDHTEGFFSDNYFDIIPGKIYKIRFKSVIDGFEKELKTITLNEAYSKD